MATFGPAPRENPLSYPGPAPRSSGLMTGGPFLPFEQLRARRLSQARVVLGDDRDGVRGQQRRGQRGPPPGVGGRGHEGVDIAGQPAQRAAGATVVAGGTTSSLGACLSAS